MKLGRKPGIERRPIEYVLLMVAAVLTVLLLWSVWSLRRTDSDDNHKNQLAEQVLEGTKDEVDRLTEEDLRAEEILDKSYDDQEESAAIADAAADNIGGVFDETVY